MLRLKHSRLRRRHPVFVAGIYPNRFEQVISRARATLALAQLREIYLSVNAQQIENLIALNVTHHVQTASAASNVHPPAKTESRQKTTSFLGREEFI